MGTFSKLSYLGSRCLTNVIKSFGIGLSGDWITIERTIKRHPYVNANAFGGITPLLVTMALTAGFVIARAG